jgi:hypothetical protein
MALPTTEDVGKMTDTNDRDVLKKCRGTNTPGSHHHCNKASESIIKWDKHVGMLSQSNDKRRRSHTFNITLASDENCGNMQCVCNV